MQELPRIPGFVDAHCHAFQRALRGRTEGGDFWAWREAMLDLSRCQTPRHVRTSYVDVYGELRAAGFSDISVSGSGAKRLAEARWEGPDRSAELPKQVTRVVEL